VLRKIELESERIRYHIAFAIECRYRAASLRKLVAGGVEIVHLEREEDVLVWRVL